MNHNDMEDIIEQNLDTLFNEFETVLQDTKYVIENSLMKVEPDFFCDPNDGKIYFSNIEDPLGLVPCKFFVTLEDRGLKINIEDKKIYDSVSKHAEAVLDETILLYNNHYDSHQNS